MYFLLSLGARQLALGKAMVSGAPGPRPLSKALLVPKQGDPLRKEEKTEVMTPGRALILTVVGLFQNIQGRATVSCFLYSGNSVFKHQKDC